MTELLDADLLKDLRGRKPPTFDGNDTDYQASSLVSAVSHKIMGMCEAERNEITLQP